MVKSLSDEDIVKKLKHFSLSLGELGITQRDIKRLKDKGYNVKHNNGKYYMKGSADDNTILISPASKDVQEACWVEVSDTHAGCKQWNPDGLEFFLDRASDEELKHCHISGDLTDGNGTVYPGQMCNLSQWQEEDQAEALAVVLRKFPLDYYAIKGNHDLSHERAGGVPVGKLIAQRVPNFHYIDDVFADLVIAGVLKRMVHGSSGQAYSKSYPSQVYIRNLLDADRGHVKIAGKLYDVRMIQFGHWHNAICYETAGIQITHAGSFQGPSEYTTRRGLVGPQGGRITRVVVRDGKVLEFDSRFVKAPYNGD